MIVVSRLIGRWRLIVGGRRRWVRGVTVACVSALGALGVAAGPAAAQTTAPAFTTVPGSPFAAGHGPHGVAYSPDGRLVAITDQFSARVSVFSIAPDGSLIQVPGSPVTVGGPSSSPSAVACSSSDVLAVSSGQYIYTYEVGDNGTLTPAPGSPYDASSADVVSLAFSRDGRTLAAGDYTGAYFYTLSVSANGTLTQAGPLHQLPSGGFVTSVAFSPGGLLAVAAGESNVSVFTVTAAGSVTQAPGSPDPTGGSDASSVAFGPGGQLAVTNENSSSVSTFTAAADGSLTPAPGSPYAAGNGPVSDAFDATGDLAVVNYTDDTVSLFSISADGSLTQEPGSPYATGVDPGSAAFSPNGLLAVANQTDSILGQGSVSEFAPSAADVVLQFPSSDPLIEPDGKTFTETLTVTNNGTSATTSPSVVQLYKPASTSLSIASLNGGVKSGQTITWPIPALAPGQAVSRNITFKAGSTASGTVQLTGSTPVPLDDADPGNNSAILPITLGSGG